eukprot:SAG31_NODE_247_length_19134_cov_12.255050_13_plen_105_part_00
MLYAVVVLQQAALVLSGEHVRPPPPPPHHPQPEPEPEPEPELEPEPEPCGHEGHEGHEGHAASEGGEHAGCGEHHGPHRIPAVRSYFLVFVRTIREIRDAYREM